MGSGYEPDKEVTMKVHFRNMISGYRGKCDGLVYYYNPRLNRILVRPYKKPKPTEHTARFAAIGHNLKTLAPSEGFKADCSVYADLWNHSRRGRHSPIPNWYNVYTKLMYALAKKYDGTQGGENPIVVDLSTITRTFIYDNDLPCISVKRAIEAGLLTSVNGYDLLTSEM
jgi:hypothetical protein